jgi:hypothetical protein
MVYRIILFFYLVLYAVMIIRDLFFTKTAEEAAPKTEEEEIDITEEAEEFQPIEVHKDAPAPNVDSPSASGMQNELDMDSQQQELSQQPQSEQAGTKSDQRPTPDPQDTVSDQVTQYTGRIRVESLCSMIEDFDAGGEDTGFSRVSKSFMRVNTREF